MKKLHAIAISVVALVFASAVPAFADGGVTAVVSGRTLTITGDDAANFLTITPGGATDAFTVTPYSSTLLNGAAGAVTFTRIHNIVAAMGAGADRLDFTSVKVRGNVRVRLDDGDDSLHFTGTAIRGRVLVRGGAGSDLVRTDSSAIFYGAVSIRGGAGNDELQLVSAQFRNWLHVDGGIDDDHVLLQSIVCTASARTEVVGGGGLDLLEVLFCQFGNDFFADMGGDEDRVRIASSRFTLDASVYGGSGEDDVLSIEGGNVFRRFQDYNGFEEGQPNL